MKALLNILINHLIQIFLEYIILELYIILYRTVGVYTAYYLNIESHSFLAV